jgi:hypothetical protein
MGYKPKKTIYKLVFEDDPDMDGLIVRAHAGTLDDVLYFDTRVPELLAGSMTDEQLVEMYERLVGLVVEWNIEDDDDQPVPVSVGSFHSFEPEFCAKLLWGWVKAGKQVSRPLETPSVSGDPSLEASIPMETLSSSLAS